MWPIDVMCKRDWESTDHLRYITILLIIMLTILDACVPRVMPKSVRDLLKVWRGVRFLKVAKSS